MRRDGRASDGAVGTMVCFSSLSGSAHAFRSHARRLVYLTARVFIAPHLLRNHVAYMAHRYLFVAAVGCIALSIYLTFLSNALRSRSPSLLICLLSRHTRIHVSAMFPSPCLVYYSRASVVCISVIPKSIQELHPNASVCCLFSNALRRRRRCPLCRSSPSSSPFGRTLGLRPRRCRESKRP